MDTYNSFPDFLKANEGVLFRFWVYRKVYTPYEQQNAFSNESQFESSYASYGVIRECVDLGNGDFLLGFQEFEDIDPENPEKYSNIDYYRLSEIRLAYATDDQHEGEGVQVCT